MNLKSRTKSLNEALIEAVWKQWAAVGAPIVAESSARNIIDPEALLLMSLGLCDAEPRLRDVIAWAAVNHSSLLSLQRLKNIFGTFPSAIQDNVSYFASIAKIDGGDLRWKSLARDQQTLQYRKSKVTADSIHLTEFPNLVFRLRRAFGVGIKADILAVLIGSHGAYLDVLALSEATSYTKRAVRSALYDLAEARLVEEHDYPTSSYSAQYSKWQAFLGLAKADGKWIYANQLYQVAIRMSLLQSEIEDSQESDYMTSSRLRELVYDNKRAFQLNRISIPKQRDYPGEEFLGAFDHILENMIRWLEREI